MPALLALLLLAGCLATNAASINIPAALHNVKYVRLMEPMPGLRTFPDICCDLLDSDNSDKRCRRVAGTASGCYGCSNEYHREN
jgi:hypothetical protein